MSETKYVFVPRKEWKTVDRITDFEKARILAVRAEQVSQDNISTLSADELRDLPVGNPALEIAKRELRLRKCPLYIDREVGRVGNTIYVERRTPN